MSNYQTDYVMKTLSFYNITKQLLVITADNARNNDTFWRQLQKDLMKKKIDWDYQQETIHCMLHSIQCAVARFHDILEVKSLRNDHAKFSRKLKFDHISSKNTGYNNVYLKICINYHIYLSHKLAYFTRFEHLI